MRKKPSRSLTRMSWTSNVSVTVPLGYTSLILITTADRNKTCTSLTVLSVLASASKSHICEQNITEIVHILSTYQYEQAC